MCRIQFTFVLNVVTHTGGMDEALKYVLNGQKCRRGASRNNILGNYVKIKLTDKHPRYLWFKCIFYVLLVIVHPHTGQVFGRHIALHVAALLASSAGCIAAIQCDRIRGNMASAHPSFRDETIIILENQRHQFVRDEVAFWPLRRKRIQFRSQDDRHRLVRSFGLEAKQIVRCLIFLQFPLDKSTKVG